MNDDTIQDLKQFIASTVHQEITGVEDRLEEKLSKIEVKLESLNSKIDEKTEEILSAVGDSTSDRFDIVEEDITKLDTRVTKLESNLA